MPTYGETRTKFLRLLKRRDCSDALADDFLADSVSRIQRVLRIPAGEKAVEVTVADVTYLDDENLPIPSDYLKLKDLTITNSEGGDRRTLVRKPLAEVQHYAEWGAQGCTKFYARRGATWIVGPLPLAGDVIRVDYYSEYESFDTDATETILLDIADDLVIYGALSYACDNFTDKRGPAFEGRFTQILSDLQAQADDDELSGNSAVQQGFSYPEDVL